MWGVVEFWGRRMQCSYGVIFLISVFGLALNSQAQEVTAAFTGRVTDPSGSPIAGAKVTATDTQRGTQWPTVTNNDGNYSIPRIPVGTYTVRVENQGFQAAQQSNITLVLNQVARLDFQLQVGNVSQSVEVTAAAPLLQTESTQLGQVIDSRTNTELPLATRNYVQLTLLAPGSVHPNPSTFKNGQTTASSGRPYVNGNREQTNNFILDGMDNNQVSDNLVGYAPSVDAIQEFNEITNNASAEFGNFMGGIISTTIRSGTNGFHGNVFEFFRNDKLNANDWSRNFTGAKRQALRWNNFGGTFGGPIKKDKLFFFVDYQGQRLGTPTSVSAASLLTAQERAGDFSQLLNPSLTNKSAIQLYNPYAIGPNGQRVPFAGNVIPANLLSPAAVNIVRSQYYPAANNNLLINNYLYSTQSAINGDQGDAKVDWNISDKDRMFGRYSRSMIDNPTTNSLPLSYNSFATYPTHNGVLDWTRTVNPTFVNDARIGVNYVLVNNGAATNNLNNFAQTVGIPGVPSAFLPSMTLSGGIANSGSGNAALAGTADVYQLFGDTVIQYGDTAILTKGKHTMHIGFQGWRQRVNTFYSGNNGRAGTFTYDGRYTTANPTGTATPTAGIAEADFLLGLPSVIGGGINGGTWGQRANIFAAFFQDDYRVSPNLTVNLGLRWELHTPWVEVKDREANFGLFSGTVLVPGQNGVSRALYNTYQGAANFQPRIGFAYTPGGGTFVIRGAYTLSSYLEGTGTNLRLTLNPPYSSERQLDYTQLRTGLPGSTLDQGYLPFAASATDPYRNALIRLWDPNIRPAVSNQWNFTVQKQLGATTTLQAGYVGQRTTHLMVPMPYLQRQLIAPGVTAISPYLSGNAALRASLGTTGQISGTASNGNQTYHALQAVAQKRLSSGIQFTAAYTWSKCMSDAIGYYGASGQSGSQSAYWQNLYDKKAEWGPCFYDVTHIGTGNVIYELPFGHNRRFGKNMNPILNAVVGEWQVSGIYSVHGGFPLTIRAADSTGTGSRGARANCVAPGHVFGRQNSPSGGYQWFDPTAYSAQTGTFGTCGVGTIRGPGLNTLDLSLVKRFSITERQNLEVRGESINFTNTPILNAPARTVGSTLGLINSSQGARNVQLGLKYNF
jgi:Carboxypeptidase regulatory-like domain